MNIDNLTQNFRQNYINKLTEEYSNDYIKNNKCRTYGVYFPTYNETNYNLVVNDIKQAIESGCNSLCIYIDERINPSDGYYNRNKLLNEILPYWNRVLSQFNDIKWKKLILRIGCGNPDTSKLNKDIFFKNYKDRIEEIYNGLKDYGITTVGIANECPNISQSQDYVKYWITIINWIKNDLNKEVMMSSTDGEVLGIPKEIMESVDMIGYNWYPIVSYNKNLQSIPNSNIQRRLKEQMIQLYGLAKHYNKKLFINECGVTTSLYSYMKAGEFHYSPLGKNITNSKIWFSNVIEFLENCDVVEGYTFFFTPLRNEEIKAMISNIYLGGKNYGEF